MATLGKTIRHGALVIFALVASERAFAATEIKDGDDVIVDGQDHRFHIADAFEPGQTCKDDQGAEYDCGARAKKALEEIIGDQPVKCQQLAPRGGRLIARCAAGDVDLEVAIIRAGWAFPRRDFRPHNPERFAELCRIEKEAREAKRGAWLGTFDIPFVQKGGKKKLADVTCPGFPSSAPAPTTSEAMSREDDVPRWVKLLSALLTLAIAGLAVVIAWAQWHAVRRREIMELSEKRMATFDALRRVVGKVVTSGKVSDDDLRDFLAGSDRAGFLFGADVVTYIAGLYHQLLKHQEAELIMKTPLARTISEP